MDSDEMASGPGAGNMFMCYYTHTYLEFRHQI